MIATAPGKLILTGEYAVLDGAPALVIAVDRRTIARRHAESVRGSSPFLMAVANELARRGYPEEVIRASLEISVDSSAFYDNAMKLGLGSSAAVTVAATALALGTTGNPLNLDEVYAIASAAHANAQAPRGSRGSGADIAAAVYGGTLAYTMSDYSPQPIARKRWPTSVTLLPFFTGVPADTPALVARVAEARTARPAAVDAALTAIADASRLAVAAMSGPADITATAVIGAFALAAAAMDRLEAATLVELVPPQLAAARAALTRLGGTAKTTGAGGGDVAIAVIPATAEVAEARRALTQIGCPPLALTVDDRGVDLRAGTS
ncbi:MAG: mevalonate kinase [Kofleriaceae bacterium]